MEELSIYPIPDGEKPLEARLIRDVPPAHFLFKIESFSLLSEILFEGGADKYESGDFEVSGYKWRLSLYPDGDKKRNGSGHISLYLVLSETNTLPLGSEVNASFKLFVCDQIRDKYLTIQDVNEKIRCFHMMKTEWGFAQLLPLCTFHDAANGYLVDDCCIFGAEVFVTNCRRIGESFSIIKEPPGRICTWKIDKFSRVDQDFIDSKLFIAGGRNWYLRLYPEGDGVEKGKRLSFYLHFLDYLRLRPGQKLYVEYKLRIKDQVHGNHCQRRCNTWFSASCQSWGFPNFMSLTDLKNKSKGFIVKDTLIVEGQITLISVVKNFW